MIDNGITEMFVTSDNHDGIHRDLFYDGWFYKK